MEVERAGFFAESFCRRNSTWKAGAGHLSQCGGQITHRDFRSSRHDHPVFDRGAQLTHVARPIVGQQRVHRFGRKIDNVFVGIEDKLQTLKAFAGARGIALDEIAYVGDDLNDLPALGAVALPIAVADAAPQVRKAVRWVTSRRGGEGAVREVCDRILAAR